jgi:rRNA processing protein Gar1
LFKLLSLCLLLKYGEQLESRNSIKEYKKMMYINTNILLHKDHKIGKICTLGIFLCLIL